MISSHGTQNPEELMCQGAGSEEMPRSPGGQWGAVTWETHLESVAGNAGGGGGKPSMIYKAPKLQYGSLGDLRASFAADPNRGEGPC